MPCARRTSPVRPSRAVTAPPPSRPRSPRRWRRTDLSGMVAAASGDLLGAAVHSWKGFNRMLPSQRALFDIPREVCFLNAASWSPLPIASQEAGRAAVARKGQPWKLDAGFAAGQHERARRAALLVDATHAVGVIAHDVRVLDPDFLVFPTYKWLLGPYGRAFLYVAKRHQNGVPLEQTSYGRRAIASERPVYFNDTNFVSGGRRFDMGERDHFISLEMASIRMELLVGWGRAAGHTRLGMLTR